jgi:hypothetical protein
VIVTDTSGHRARGTVTSVSATGVDLGGGGHIDAAAIRRIDIQDSLWNGAARGAVAIGLPLFYPLWNAQYCDSCSALRPVLEGLAIGATIGAIIDGAHTHRAFGASTGPQVRLAPMRGGRSGLLAQVRF